MLGWSALGGFAAWCVLGELVHKRWTTMGLDWGLQLNITGIFLVAPLITTPLALLLAAPPVGGSGRTAWQWAAMIQPFAAVAVLGSFFAPTGMVAAALILPWIAMAACSALAGLGRFSEHDFSCPEEIVIDIGLVNVLVGALWLAASRAGWGPLVFQEPFVLLGAVHFHFAGFAAPVIVGLAGRRLRTWNSRGRALYVALAAGIVIGLPLIFAGVISHTKFELVAALILAFSLGGFCLFSLFAVVPRLRGWTGRILLAIAFLSALYSMHYAGHYAAGIARGGAMPAKYALPHMATIHGLLNALGFSLCGLLGWIAVGRAELSSSKSVQEGN